MTEKLKYYFAMSTKHNAVAVYRRGAEEDGDLLFLCDGPAPAYQLVASLNLGASGCSGGEIEGARWCGFCPKCLYADYVMLNDRKVPNPHLGPVRRAAAKMENSSGENLIENKMPEGDYEVPTPPEALSPELDFTSVALPTEFEERSEGGYTARIINRRLASEPGIARTIIGVDLAEPGSDKTVIHTFEPPIILDNDKTQAVGTTPMAEIIEEVMEEMTKLLLKKNKSYGNSVAEPVRIFSKVSNIEQINVRIDDKLSRLIKGEEFETEDTEMDLAGYFILKRCVEKYNGIKRGGKAIEST